MDGTDSSPDRHLRFLDHPRRTNPQDSDATGTETAQGALTRDLQGKNTSDDAAFAQPEEQ